MTEKTCSIAAIRQKSGSFFVKKFSINNILSLVFGLRNFLANDSSFEAVTPI